jgi:hypothetical protein
MSFSISDFTASMKFGGARPHLFQVEMALPVALLSISQVAFTRDLPVKATTTQIPASTVEPIPVAYQGRFVNFSGNRTYQPWTVEILNDEDFGVYDAFTSWLAALNDPILNVRMPALSSEPSTYKSMATIMQYGQDGGIAPIKTWEVLGIFPINVSEIQLAWEQTNQIERFAVTFAVDAVVPIKLK